jgi:hypothetical protein
VQTGQVSKINPNSYEIDESMKAEAAGVDGKKLKDAFLMRPPNN